MSELKKSRRLALWLLVACLPVVGGGAYLWFGRHKSSPAAVGVPATYRVQAVTRSSAIDVTGNLKPVESEDIGFAASGKVARVYVKEGDRVRAGDLIAELDDSQQRYDLASLDYKIEKARISGSKSELELLALERQLKQVDLQEKKVWTTISGIVSNVDVREGEYVKAGETISPIARIIDLSALMAEVEIDELDVPSVKVGQKVVFHIDALPDLEVTGRVSLLPLEGRVTTEGIAVLDAEVRIDHPPKSLLPGYSFSARIVAAEDERLLVLDEKALQKVDGRSYVLLPPATSEASPAALPRQPERREVKTAAYETGKVRVLEGLSEGDVVLAAAAAPAGGRAAGRQSANPLSIFGFRMGGRAGGPPPGGQR
jgi:multidrug efflux pump subunit AcrA (membrane-fusion protein)